MSSAFLYPVALDVRGRRCVVIGGGNVAARKASALRDAGACVVIVAPETAEETQRLIETGAVCLLREPFTPSHLEHAFLVIAATDNPDVNDAAARAARERGVLVNLASPGTDDAGDGGDFATMAPVRRGDLLIGITTGGAGPALSARLRREIEERFGPDWEPFVSLLGEMRAEAKAHIADTAARTAALRRLAASDHIREMLAVGDADGAKREAMQCLSR
jgi:precorrin-2 dehydrogenase / sirohydrochlorin ferrochelatase